MPLAAFPLALIASLALMPLVIRAAWAVGYLDHPEARKLHTAATPLLGGAGVCAAALVVWAALLTRIPHAAAGRDAWLMVAGAGIALGLGLWDDRFGMRPSIKMLGQAAAAAAMLTGGGVPQVGLPAAVTAGLALVGLIGLMNAVNFLDNMNGMVGGLAPIALAGFAWTSLARGANGLAAAQFALAGACVGFLPYNFPRARLFLGDAGSLLLGYALGASALLAVNGSPAVWGKAGPLLVLAYPAFDLVFAVITRLRDGHPVYEGGKDHTNHRLALLVGSPVATVPLLWLGGAALCASGLAVLAMDRPAPTFAITGAWLALLLAGGFRLAAVPVVRRG